VLVPISTPPTVHYCDALVFRYGYELRDESKPARSRLAEHLTGWTGVGTPPALTSPLAEDIATLWADPALGQAYDRRSEFQVRLNPILTAEDTATLWADPALGQAYDRRSEFKVRFNPIFNSRGYCHPVAARSRTGLHITVAQNFR
jgi:hypothetical protein